MVKSYFIAGCYFAASMLFHGCSSSDNGEEQKVVVGEDQYATQHPSTVGGGPKAHIVAITEMKFQPDDVTIDKGDTVVFQNNDIVIHDITEEKSKAWRSAPLAAGASWRFVPTQSADYYCSIHPVMKGKITIR
jgi:plastocyanin